MVSTTEEGVQAQGEKFRLAGLIPKTEILTSEASGEFYQWWTQNFDQVKQESK